jgi:outer membrane protein assembly factor BamB
MRISALCALAVTAMFVPVATHAWTVRLNAAPTVMVTDSLGNVVAAVPLARRHVTITDIVKLDDRTGTRRWRHRIRAPVPQASPVIGVVAPIGSADVVVAGSLQSSEETHETDVLVARLAGDDGHESWRRLLRGRAARPIVAEARAVAVDPAGDVLVGGALQNTDVQGDYGSLTVAKLDGADGTERWRFSLPGPLHADVLAVDSHGDAVAAGFVSGAPLYPTAITPAAVAVVKLAGATGAPLWRRDLDVAWDTKSVAFDASGDVFLAVRTAGLTDTNFAVIKLAGTTGEPIWLARESGIRGEAFRVLVDPSDAVYAAGTASDSEYESGNIFTVVRLDVATGQHLWTYQVRGKRGGSLAKTLLLDSSGTLIAGGYATGLGTCTDGLAIGLEPATGARLWSRTVDGTLTTHVCDSSCAMGICGVADNDQITALAVDPTGRLIVAGLWVNRGEGHGGSGFVRRLRVPH